MFLAHLQINVHLFCSHYAPWLTILSQVISATGETYTLLIMYCVLEPRCFTQIILFSLHRNLSELILQITCVKHEYLKKNICALPYDECLKLNLKGVLYNSETCVSGSVKQPPNIFDEFSWELGCHCEEWGSSLLFSLGIYAPMSVVCLGLSWSHSVDVFYCTNK